MEKQRPSSAPLPRARKQLGQNFLTDPSIAEKIVRFLDPAIGVETPIIEVGPGRGILSKALKSRTKALILLEKDPNLQVALQELFANDPHVRILITDALTYPFGTGEDYEAPPFGGGDYRIVSNLPYNVSVPLLFRFLQSPRPPSEMILMFQREVARRMVASPGTDDYGHLSVAMALQASVKKILDLKPGSFFPAPKVHSSVVLIKPRLNLDNEESSLIEATLSLSRQLFSYRRRTLVNAIGLAFPDRDRTDHSDIVRSSGIAPEKRVEKLTPEEFTRIAKNLTRFMAKGQSGQEIPARPAPLSHKRRDPGRPKPD